MGDIRKSPALALRDAFGLRYAIETGTWKGDTALWLGENFEFVTTVEADFDLWAEALARLEEHENICCECDDSAIRLRELLSQAPTPALLFLDAHWCSGNGHERPDVECPLRGELMAVRPCDFVIIDDATYYTTGDPTGLHTPTQWPTLDEIKRYFHQSYFIAVHNDFIIAVPPEAQSIVEEWMNE